MFKYIELKHFFFHSCMCYKLNVSTKKRKTEGERIKKNVYRSCLLTFAKSSQNINSNKNFMMNDVEWADDLTLSSLFTAMSYVIFYDCFFLIYLILFAFHKCIFIFLFIGVSKYFSRNFL